MRFRRQHRRDHVCLVPRGLVTVEHLGTVRRQALETGAEVCWLDLGDDDKISDAVRTWADANADPISVTSPKELRRHVKRHRSRGVFIQSPYPEHYPEWFWPVAADAGLVYSGYGINISTWEEGHYGLVTYELCSAVIVESEEIRSHHIRWGADPESIHAFGSPLLYQVRRRLQESSPLAYDLMWAPHWTADWFGSRGYSRWRDYARADPGRSVLVRPHPLLPAGIADDHGPDADAYRQLVELPNVMVSSGPILDDIAASERC